MNGPVADSEPAPSRRTAVATVLRVGGGLLVALGANGVDAAITASSASASAASAASSTFNVGTALDGLAHNAFLIAAGSAVGAVISWFAKEWSADWAARRTFTQDTTKRVVDLSSQHYWALANATGTVGATLRNHLRQLELHLLLHYAEEGLAPEDAARQLQQRIAEVAKESSDRAFAALVRMIHQFDQFQFRGSKTYLLPTQTRGHDLRRLYNQIANNLPEGSFLTDVRHAVEKHLVAEGKTGAGEPPPGIAGTFLEREAEFPALGFAPLRARYEAWLLRDLPAVCEVERAATAFEHILQAELDRMTVPFFKWWKRGPEPRDLRIESVIERSWAAGTSYMPLGGTSIAGFAAPAPTGAVSHTDQAGPPTGPADDAPRPPGPRGPAGLGPTSPLESGIGATGTEQRS